MKIKKYIYIAAAAILSSCQSEEIIRYVYSVGEADNTIQLSAGISDGHSGVMTRAGAEDHHTTPGHMNFINGTKLTLRVDGTWTGHDPVSITKTTTATIGAETGTDSKHNTVTFTDAEKLYWDDYGTADPANASTGRTTGLTIYGVAVDGATTAPSVSDWTSLSWTLEANQTSGWAAKDLLTSNNVQTENTTLPYATDGTYKFTDRNTGKLLEFTHAMTKITVNLKAGEGFVNAKFVNKPTVTLLQFYYTGKYDVVSKTPAATTDSKTNINAHLAQVKTVSTAEWSDAPATWASSNMAKFDALVFPGNQFTATIADDANMTPTSSTDILELNADGNVLKVTSAQLVKAIAGTSTTGTPVNSTLEQGKNYILNITVNKTDIEVTATIKDWEDVETENVTPKINVNEVYGHPTQDGHPAFQKKFDLYRSTSIEGSFLGTDDHSVVSYADSKYTMSPQLYWPNHNTHYFFRGVWPLVGSKDNEEAQLGPTSTQVESNAIVISNATYKKGYYPSDLMIGRPLNTDDKTPDETCKVAGHSSAAGICATEGNVHINFRYVMSQVEVHLETATGSPTPANAVELTNAKVEIINGYTTGKVSLGEFNSDGSFKITVLSEKADFTLAHVDGENGNYRHSAIVPQILTYSTDVAQKENNLRFKITIYKNGETSQGIDDIYYADVEPILKSDKSGKVAPNGKWESGVHYIYNLMLTKTEIKVTATITDWVTVNASEDVWF